MNLAIFAAMNRVVVLIISVLALCSCRSTHSSLSSHLVQAQSAVVVDSLSHSDSSTLQISSDSSSSTVEHVQLSQVTEQEIQEFDTLGRLSRIIRNKVSLNENKDTENNTKVGESIKQESSSDSSSVSISSSDSATESEVKETRDASSSTRLQFYCVAVFSIITIVSYIYLKYVKHRI